MILIAYLFSVKKANTISSAQTWTSMIVEVGHILIWIVVAILYRVGKSGKDLWGWACSPLAQNIQPNFNGVVHFSRVCSRGVSAITFIVVFLIKANIIHSQARGISLWGVLLSNY